MALTGTHFRGPLSVAGVEIVDVDGNVTAPVEVSDLEEIKDSSGNEMLEFDSNASAVNFIRLANAATGVAPVASTQGDDTNIDFRLEPKGTGVLEVYSDEAGATGAIAVLRQDSASPAAADVVGRIRFDGEDAGSVQTNFARIDGVIRDTTNASEDGDLEFYVMRAGTVTKSLALDSDVNGVVVGDGAAAGIVRSSGDFDLQLDTGNATTSKITITDGASGAVTVDVDGTSGEFVVTNDDAGALGAVMTLYGNSASPAAADVIGRIRFDGEDAGGVQTIFGRIDSVIRDTTNATEDGDLEFYVMRAGTVTKSLALDSDVNGVVVGDGAAAGIVQSSGDFDAILRTGNATTSSITITDGAAGAITLSPNTTGEVVLANTDAGALGSVLRLSQTSASAAANDVVARIVAQGLDDAAAAEEYGRIDVVATDLTAANPDGDVVFYANVAGTLTEKLRLVSTVNGAQVGSGAADGVLQSNGNHDMILRTGNAATSRIQIADGAAGTIALVPDTTGVVEVYNAEAGAVGAQLSLYQESASPAALDAVGTILFQGEDSTSAKTNYADVRGLILDATDTTEDAVITVRAMTAGTLTTSATFIGGAVIVGSAAADGTVQSDGNFDLILKTGNAATSRIQITDGAAGTIALVPETTGIVEVYNAEAGAEGARLSLYQESASPAALDAVGTILFQGEDSTSAKTNYADVRGIILDTTDTTEDAVVSIRAMTAGAMTIAATFAGGRVMVGSAAAAGTVQSDGDFDLILQTGNATTGNITITDGANGNISMNMNGSGDLAVDGDITNTGRNGALGTGVTAKEFGDGRKHVTVLTLTNVALGNITGGADQALGGLIYTFPAGAHIHEVTYMSVGVTTAGGTKTDTPDVGIGSIVGAGAFATLNLVGATAEDYITGQSAADANGTATVAMTAATAGYGTGISLNLAAGTKAVYFNAADGWAAGAAGALTASGSVSFTWTAMS